MPGARLCFDLYLPETTPKRVVLFAHGGGFFKGDRVAGLRPALRDRLVAEGFALASISYRLGTPLTAFAADEQRQIRANMKRAKATGLPLSRRLCGAAFEAARRDMARAVTHLNALSQDIDAKEKIPAVVGVSAGGIAALSLASEPVSDRFPQPPASVVTLSAAIVRPWALGPATRPALMLHSVFDRVIPPQAAEMARDAATQEAAPVSVLTCARKGHNQTIDALLEDRDETGATYFSRALQYLE